jgi:methyl-accepting chemotaxis protein
MATSILQWMTSFVTGRNGAGAQSSRDDENRKRVADLAQVGQQVAAELRQVRTYNDVVRKQLELVVSETEKAAFDITSRLQTIDEVVGQLNHFVTTTSNESSEFLAVSEDRLKHNRSLVDALERYIHERIGTAESDQKRVAQVVQEAQSLGGLVELIKSISSQTNLLALNAAIDAPARQGAASPSWPMRSASSLPPPIRPSIRSTAAFRKLPVQSRRNSRTSWKPATSKRNETGWKALPGN